MLSRLFGQLKGDRVIWMVTLLLALFSLLIVYSATGILAYKYQGGNTEYYLLKQLGMLGFGGFILYLGYLMHYKRYNLAAPYLLVVAGVLLFYTLFFGTDINQARRWIELPVIGITFQTSDFAKIALILYVARAISAKQEYIKSYKEAFLPIIVPVLVICALIAPADLSSAALLFFTCLMLMFMGRVDAKYIGLLLVMGVVVFAFLIMVGKAFPEFIRSETWANRLGAFVNAENEEYMLHVNQSKIAIARGGVFGVGPGNSIQRNYLPHPYSDFIYSIIIEEYGLFGGLAIMMLYLTLFIRCVRLVTRSPKAFGAMLALGLSLILTLQALANMAVAVHLVPVTGLTLPLVSMGGTSTIFTCVAIGMILSVSKHIESSQ
ncbi:MAG: FtsW/RodA/SpoVE family cell cycle protein [Saprospiraceae bacterium]